MSTDTKGSIRCDGCGYAAEVPCGMAEEDMRKELIEKRAYQWFAELVDVDEYRDYCHECIEKYPGLKP